MWFFHDIFLINFIRIKKSSSSSYFDFYSLVYIFFASFSSSLLFHHRSTFSSHRTWIFFLPLYPFLQYLLLLFFPASSSFFSPFLILILITNLVRHRRLFCVQFSSFSSHPLYLTEPTQPDRPFFTHSLIHSFIQLCMEEI